MVLVALLCERACGQELVCVCVCVCVCEYVCVCDGVQNANSGKASYLHNYHAHDTLDVCIGSPLTADGLTVDVSIRLMVPP